MNVQRKVVATDVMSMTDQEERANVMVMSEPNTKEWKGGGHEKGVMYGKEEGFVWVQFSEWVPFGCYISPSSGITRKVSDKIIVETLPLSCEALRSRISTWTSVPKGWLDEWKNRES